MANDYKKWAMWGGYAVVFLTHAYMLAKGLPVDMVTIHAVGNLVAGAAIYWGNN